MKFPSIKSSRGRQRGAVLIVALIMLVVSTLLVISMTKTSLLELKIAGSDQVYAHNFANAETAIAKFIADNSGRFAPGFLTLAAANGGVIISPPTGLVGGTVTLAATQVTCAPATGSTINTNNVVFDVAATATGTLAGSTLIMHQGLLTTAKSCSTGTLCNASGHDNDCASTCKPSGHDSSGHDCNFTCDVSGTDASGAPCTMKTNPGVSKAYWYVESEQ